MPAETWQTMVCMSSASDEGTILVTAACGHIGSAVCRLLQRTKRKRLAVELIGETLAKRVAIQFVSLRIARVVGPGIKKTSSPWRSQILEPLPRMDTIHIPFSPEATLSLVHAEDVARMLVTLADTAEMFSFVYNTPVEIWEPRRLKELIEELRSIRVDLGPDLAHGGPMCDGSRFAREFGFQLRSLRDYLSDCTKKNIELRTAGRFILGDFGCFCRLLDFFSRSLRDSPV